MRVSKKDRTIRDKAILIREVVLKKKAIKAMILDLRKISNLCDYFVLCSGDSQQQIDAIYEEVIKLSKEKNILIHHRQNDGASGWLLIDFFNVIVHIFSEEMRNFYDMEHLWKEATRVRVPKKIKLHTPQ